MCIALVVSFLEGNVPSLEYIIRNAVFIDNFGRMLLTVTLSGKKVILCLICKVVEQYEAARTVCPVYASVGLLSR